MDLAQRPPYTAVDFEAVAQRDNNFRATWEKSTGKLDFQDPATTVVLSKAILKVDFGLELEVHEHRLCPPIPNRWNYVAWIQRLIDSTSPLYSSSYDRDRQVIGLDIGTGSSAIYTMLCLKSRSNWRMCATEVDTQSSESAARNLTQNNLIERTTLIQTSPLNNLVPLIDLGVDTLDFTICNPPFFTSPSSMESSLKGEGKKSKPSAICTGAEVEMVYPGGDQGFVAAIVDESLVLRGKVQWYSSLLGKLESAKAIVTLLKKHKVSNWAVGVVDTGGVTKRWIVAWSFGSLRPQNDIARLETIANEYLPFPTLYTIQLPVSIEIEAAKNMIITQVSSLDLRWQWNSSKFSGVGIASQNVWKRAYRREYEKKIKEGTEAVNQDAEHGDAQLVFRIKFSESAREVAIEWLQGTDRVLWESFCGLIHRHFKKP